MWEWIMGLAEALVDGCNPSITTGYFGPNSRAPGFWSNFPSVKKIVTPILDI
jgi:hypothetical protein